MRLDIFHFMRRVVAGLTTEHHALFGTFLSKLSSAIFKWDKVDIEELREAKKREMRRATNRIPTESQVTDSITTSELAKHCRRCTRGVEESRTLIQAVLDVMWNLTDTLGVPLINKESMAKVWEVCSRSIFHSFRIHLALTSTPKWAAWTKVAHSSRYFGVPD